MDCDGLVILVARDLGLVAHDFDINGYGRSPDGRMQGLCEMHMAQCAGPEIGAVLLMQPNDQPQHMGIVGDYRHGGLSLIHAENSRGVIESRLMFAKNLRYICAYRLPGVAYV